MMSVVRSLVLLASCGAALEVPAALSAGARLYAQGMRAHPVATKSATAALIFAASDVTAQRLERTSDPTRLGVTTAIGGLYFAPAAHYWYEIITRFIPGNRLQHILLKATLGQVIFGPLVTVIFFAAACAQSKEGIRALPGKIRSDLVAVQVAGVGFWPFVDLISFSFIPVAYIPLFINVASFVWTIYLSLKSRKRATD